MAKGRNGNQILIDYVRLVVAIHLTATAILWFTCALLPTSTRMIELPDGMGIGMASMWGLCILFYPKPRWIFLATSVVMLSMATWISFRRYPSEFFLLETIFNPWVPCLVLLSVGFRQFTKMY